MFRSAKKEKEISINVLKIPKINDFLLIRFSDFKVDRFSPRKSKMVVHDLIHHVKLQFFAKKANLGAKNCQI